MMEGPGRRVIGTAIVDTSCFQNFRYEISPHFKKTIICGQFLLDYQQADAELMNVGKIKQSFDWQIFKYF
jgi:hypothetical protein